VNRINGNVTLPFIQLFKQGDANTRKLLLKNFRNKNVTPLVAEEIENKMRKFGVFEYCKRELRSKFVKLKHV